MSKKQLKLTLGFASSKQKEFMQLIADLSPQITLLSYRYDQHVCVAVIKSIDPSNLARFKKTVSQRLIE